MATGDSTYTTDVLNSQKMKDPLEARRYQDELEEGQKSVSRWITGAPVMGLNRFQKQAVDSEALAGEQERRQQAATGAMQVAGSIDERLTGAANTLSGAYDKAQSTQADLAQKQAQSLQEAEWAKTTGLRDVADKTKDVDFQLLKNQTLRDDALEDAWVKGIMDNKLQDMSIGGDMRLQDIDQYFKLKENEIQEDFLDWQKKTEIDFNAEIAKMVASAQAFATLFQGVMQGSSAIAQEVAKRW